MKKHWHEWSNWGAPFETEVTIEAGRFGDTAQAAMVFQERTCKVCGIVEARKIRDGELKDPRDA